MPGPNKRVLWLDFIRAISIYFVLIIHNEIVLPNATTFAFGSIIASSVPLFVMISGVLLLNKKESYSVFFKKRANKVLIPWIFWTFIFMIWHIFVDHYDFNGFSISSLMNLFEKTLFNELWFLPMIFGIYLLTPPLKIFIQNSKNKDIFYIALIWFIAVCIMPAIHQNSTFPVYLSGIAGRVLQFTGYFILGFALSKVRLPKHGLIITLFLLLFGIFCSVLEAFILPQYLGKIEGISYFDPGIVITSSGIFLFIKEVFSAYDRNIPDIYKKFIVLLSKTSLGIYIIHYLFMRITKPYIIVYFGFLKHLDPVFTGPVLALVFLIPCFFIIYLFQKLPFLKHIVP